MEKETVVVKLGGSVVTDKASPFTYRGEAVLSLSREMAASGLRLVVVHGGGSFGHPVAKEHGLSSRRSTGTAEGVSRTRDAMLRLNQLVCSSMREAGLSPYPFAPFDLLVKGEGGRMRGAAGRSPSASARWVESLLDAGLQPVTFGDVVRDRGGGFRILSGDTIAYRLCRLLVPDRCVFALDAEGLYDEVRNVIPTVMSGAIGELRLGRSADATGGIRLKMREAARIAALGVPTALVSGNEPREFAKCLRGLGFHGTIVKGPS